jgi:hypothetical protein
MKRSLIIIFLGMLLMNAVAQDSTAIQQKCMVGVHGGAGPASMVGSDMYWGSDAKDLTHMIGSINGIVFQYRVSKRISFCFEANYERKGYAVYGIVPRIWNNDYYDSTIPWSGKTKYIYDFITLPALVQFKINRSKRRTEWFIKGGLNPELLIRSGVIYGKEEIRYDKEMDPFKDLSAVAGFGVNIPVKKHVVISIEGRDMLTLGDILSIKKRNLAVLMVGLGYKI